MPIDPQPSASHQNHIQHSEHDATPGHRGSDRSGETKTPRARETQNLVRRTRTATTAMFFTNGMTIASLAPRYPEIKLDLGLSNTAYGLAIASVPIGALAFGWLAGKAVRKFGDAKVATLGTILMACAAWLSTLSPTLVLFIVPLAIMGALDSIVDVAQNVHGLRVQRIAKQTIINSFHAFWSLGVVSGGLLATTMLYLSVSRQLHLAIVAILLTAVASAAYLLRLPPGIGQPDATHAGKAANNQQQPSDTQAHSTAQLKPTAQLKRQDQRRAAGQLHTPLRIWFALGGLSLLGVAACMVEDLGPAWSTQYLSSIGASAALAPLGYVSLMTAEFIGRITGDRIVDALGQRTVAICGGLMAVIGLSTAIALPTIPGVVIGFAAAGFGVATIGPLAMEAADNLPHLPPGTGLTITSWLLRFGFLISPPLVGVIADHVSLRPALAVYPIAGVFIVLLAPLLHGKQSTRG